MGEFQLVHEGVDSLFDFLLFGRIVVESLVLLVLIFEVEVELFDAGIALLLGCQEEYSFLEIILRTQAWLSMNSFRGIYLFDYFLPNNSCLGFG